VECQIRQRHRQYGRHLREHHLSWWPTDPCLGTGLIDVDTQCRSCHVYGTTQYNGYYSGRHQKHVIDKRLDCLNCHDAAKLKNGHFGNLSTAGFELAPSATIKDSSATSNGTCLTRVCHGARAGGNPALAAFYKSADRKGADPIGSALCSSLPKQVPRQFWPRSLARFLLE